MNRPFFSLITPVYNIERLVGKTIESALEQTFIHWEIILVDDGSPDHAGEICDKYASEDDRIRVIHKQNEGLAEARNTGIRACKGRYFIILEGSDLFFDKNTLKDIYETLKDREVDIYFARLQDMLEQGWKVTNVQAEYCVNGLFTEGGKNLFIKLYDNEDVLALSSPVNKVFRTSYVKDNELWFYKGLYHDDDEWIPRAISLSKLSFFTNKIIYNALTWDGCFGQASSDRSLMKKACDKMLIAQHCCEDIDRRFPNESDSKFKRKYYEYYVRMYISSFMALEQIKDAECKLAVEDAIEKHKSVFEYAGKCESKNLRMLSVVKRLLGIDVVKKLVLKRYTQS